MNGRVVIGCYRPKPGMDEVFITMMRREVPMLRGYGFLAPDPVLLMYSPADKVYIHVARWANEDSADRAHENDQVMHHWNELAGITDYLSLSELSAAGQQFPEFEVIYTGL